MNSPYWPIALQQRLAALRARLLQHHRRLRLHLLRQLANRLARRVLVVARARHKRPPRPIAQHHHAPAVVAELLFLLLDRILPSGAFRSGFAAKFSLVKSQLSGSTISFFLSFSPLQRRVQLLAVAFESVTSSLTLGTFRVRALHRQRRDGGTSS